MERTMNAGPDLTTLATAVGDATRIRMLELLMEGRALVAKELAFGTGVSPATATAHLKRLEQARLIRSTQQGRNKVFQLATPTVARMVEALMSVAVRGPRASATPEPLRAARYCYDHLAGRLGMAITDALLRAGHLSLRRRAFALTPSGEVWCQDFGIDLSTVREQRRHFAHRCLDWSERRDHLAGALGAALAARVFALGWVERQPGSRGLIVTPGGQRGLKRHFGEL